MGLGSLDIRAYDMTSETESPILIADTPISVDDNTGSRLRIFVLIENLNENLNEVLPKILIFDEVLDEVLDF